MDVKFWSADAHTGIIQGELHAVGNASLEMMIGGGKLSLEVPLGHLTKRDGTPDLAACNHYLGLCAPGARTIVATSGTTVLGEWLILTRSRSFSGVTMKVGGAEWDAYPSQRQVHTARTLTGDLTGLLARTILNDLYASMNSIEVSVPTVNAGTTASMDELARSGRYYSDVLTDLADQNPGFEWRVDLTGTFNNTALTKVTRAVSFGIPVLKGVGAMSVRAPGPDERSGAVLDLAVSENFERTASAVYVRGAGDGAKQVVGKYSDPSAQSASGWVSRTRVYSYPDVTKQVSADRVARRLSDLSQSPWEASDLCLILDRLPAVPRIGGRIAVTVPPTFVLPDGYNYSLRVGKISMDVEAGQASVIRVSATEEG